MRQEQEIFDDLAKICASPGFIHVIAYVCFRDNIVGFNKEMTVDDMRKLFSANRLIRTEITTLIGLLVKHELDLSVPDPETFERLLNSAEKLLEEIHQAVTGAIWADLFAKGIEEKPNPLSSGKALREPIFYGGESAYSFQYRDFAPLKYRRDDEWLQVNKGFSIQTARDIALAIGQIQEEKILSTLRSLRKIHPSNWTLLPGFVFTIDEIALRSGINRDSVKSVLDAFALPNTERNGKFSALYDFNVVAAYPLLRLADDTYLLFQAYSLTEALYEAPFYWMGADKKYVDAAMSHRGLFTEEFARERLERVFGRSNVYSNIDIVDSDGTTVGEIDVLVLFGDRAIILQAKSKRLTLESRKGNDGQIQDDFKKSVQDSYEQGLKCAELLSDPKYTFLDSKKRELRIGQKLKEIQIICLVSDHYPALFFQTRQFLKFKTTEIIHAPFVMDVFALDAMSEMLESPLRLLSYINRRTGYSEKLMAAHEHTILSYHLKKNLWIDEKHDLVSLEDDIATDLDISMAVRREGLPGKRTPDGILTRFNATTLGRMVSEIESRPDSATIDLGFMLLSLSENTVLDISKGIDKICSAARQDKRAHDITVGIGRGDTGLTIHCNDDPPSISGPRLQNHCELRKYSFRANSWFGLCIHPRDASVRFGVNLNYIWKSDAAMDEATRNLPKSKSTSVLAAMSQKRKIGRNDPCTCGSGKKYKKCCLGR